MKYLYSPQRSDDRLHYTFEQDIIHVAFIKQNGNVYSDSFDFTAFTEDGVATEINTTLPVQPILSAKREDGELYVELLYYHGKDATHEELYPEWEEVETDGGQS
jgi:hypothetical protein